MNLNSLFVVAGIIVFNFWVIFLIILKNKKVKIIISCVFLILLVLLLFSPIYTAFLDRNFEKKLVGDYVFLGENKGAKLTLNYNKLYNLNVEGEADIAGKWEYLDSYRRIIILHDCCYIFLDSSYMVLKYSKEKFTCENQSFLFPY